MKQLLLFFWIAVWACALVETTRGDQAADEAAIRAAVTSYVEAFNKQDAKALAGHWSDQAVYQNPITGEEVTGRGEIEKQFAAQFGEFKDAKLTVEVTAVNFVSPNVAVEEGIAHVKTANGEPDVTEYSAVHVRHGNKWLLDRVTENEEIEAVSHYEQLKPLEWLIGTWVDEDEEARVETTCQWAKNQNYLTRSFTVEMPNEPAMSGIQVIGWDAAAGKIRSWAFDSDGGFMEGTWKNKDNNWIIESAAVLPDGRKASSINILKPLENDAITWQVTGRDIDGEILPNLPEVKLSRAAAQ